MLPGRMSALRVSAFYFGKYKIKYKESEGYVYSKYLVTTHDEAIKYYNDGAEHKTIGNTLGGGTASLLDYYPEEKANFEHTLDMVKSNADTEALKETSNACDGKLVINTDIQAPDYVAIGNEINSKVTGGNATWSFGTQDDSGTNMPENNKASEDMETDNKVSGDEASDNKSENKEISRFGSAWDQNINGGR